MKSGKKHEDSSLPQPDYSSAFLGWKKNDRLAGDFPGTVEHLYVNECTQ
jgi:hypothetical protein